jgi:hypothetical protein
MYFVHVEEIEATVKVYKVGSHGLTRCRSEGCSPRLIGSAHSQSGHCDWLRSVDGIESGGGCGVDEGVVAGGVLVF